MVQRVLIENWRGNRERDQKTEDVESRERMEEALGADVLEMLTEYECDRRHAVMMKWPMEEQGEMEEGQNKRTSSVVNHSQSQHSCVHPDREYL